MQWGKGRGCDFLDSCSSEFPEFHDNADDIYCSFYHFGLGVALSEDFSDSCLIYQLYSNTGCTEISG